MKIINNDFSKNEFIEVSDNSLNHKSSSILFNLSYWENNKEKLVRQNYNLGIKFSPDEQIEKIYQDNKFFKLICINFLSFKDGRPFSFARKLRERYNYKFKIRASGQILPDQYIFLLRCGFDSFEINEIHENTWRKILENNPGVYYQSTGIKIKKNPLKKI